MPALVERPAAPADAQPDACRFCGCTDDKACPGGCWWIDEEHTVCSARPCVDQFFAEKAAIVDEIFASMRGNV